MTASEAVSDPTIGVLVENIIEKVRGAIAHRLCAAVQATETIGHPSLDVAVYISGVEAWHDVYQGVLFAFVEHLGAYPDMDAMQTAESACGTAIRTSIRLALDEYLDGESAAADLNWETILDDISSGRDTAELRLATAASFYATSSLRAVLTDKLTEMMAAGNRTA